MRADEFKKWLQVILLEFGFSKECSAYYKRSEEIIFVVGLQKSQFTEAYYVNVGFLIRNLHPGVLSPRFVDGDSRARFSFAADGKHSDLFDPCGWTSVDRLKDVIRRNVEELNDGSLSIAGLKSLLERRPEMLYQVTLVAKKYLGIES